MLSKLSPMLRTYDTVAVVSVGSVERTLHEQFASRGAVFSTLEEVKQLSGLPRKCNLVACLKEGLKYEDELWLKRLASQLCTPLVFCLKQAELARMLDFRLSKLSQEGQADDDPETIKRRFVEGLAPGGASFNIQAETFRIKVAATQQKIPNLNQEQILKILVGIKYRRKKQMQEAAARAVEQIGPVGGDGQAVASGAPEKIEVPWVLLDKAEVLNLPPDLRRKSREHSLRPAALNVYISRIFAPELGWDLVQYAKTIYVVAINNGFPAAKLGEVYKSVYRLHKQHIDQGKPGGKSQAPASS